MSGVGTTDGIQPGSPEAIADAERGQQAADDLQRIRAMPRRADVLARQQAARTDPREIGTSGSYSWRPRRPWHVYELVRTAAAAVQVGIGLAILLKVY